MAGTRAADHPKDSRRRLRGHARPAHPPFTDFPVAGYVFVAGFDLASALGGTQRRWPEQLWHAGTFVLAGGLVICLITMGTGFADLVRFAPRSGRAMRTAAAHVCAMAAVFMIGAGDLAWQLSDYGSAATAPPGVVALSVAAAIIVCTGAFLGGRLVFSHGVGVAAEALAPGPGPGRPAADDQE
ncbi:MAG TPA: DUF2231 domain-containing protein [Streptosporangiaceae bacterium]|jgi:uncharacterized membrane protein